MKVIFLDFDGVLNNQGSFIKETRKRKNFAKANNTDEATACSLLGQVNHSLDETNASNFQYILEKHPDAKIVISSTWRLHFTLEQLEEKLMSYGVDAKGRIVGKTPRLLRGFNSAPRYSEIQEYLREHSEITNYVILDDEEMYYVYKDRQALTHWWTGLCFSHAKKAIDLLDDPAAPVRSKESEYEEE